MVIQDFLTKWPWVFPLPDQKTKRLVDILVESIIPMCGVPEALLSDRGTNLLSFLMKDVCDCLGIEKLNTTAYHPQCDGLTERFNRTLKTMLRKHAASYGTQWDKYLHGVVWAYRNVPHESTSENPSYLLFGRDCRYPVEAAFLPVTEPELTDVSDYCSELVTTLSQARDLAVQSIQEAQRKYKRQYDKVNKCMRGEHKIGSWVLIRFPQEESGGLRNLSRPWHGPYRVIEVTPTGITTERVYTLNRNPIRVHLRRVSRCPPNFPIFGMVIEEMGQVDHPTGLPILWKCQHQVQNRAMERLMTQNLRVVLHGKWLKMLIFHEILQEQMLRLIPRLLVQEQGLSHPLIATSEAQDELLQEPECVTVISNLSPPKRFFIPTHTHPHIFYITPYPFP